MDQRPKLIVLEGIDGVGKTTLAKQVADRLRGRVVYCSPKEIATIHPHVEWSMQTLASILWPTEQRKQHAHRLRRDYWLHLQAAWYAVLSDAVIEPRIASGQTLLVDGWFYKFIAKLLVDGMELAALAQAFRHARRPDTVFLIEASPEEVWGRRNSFSSYEMGSIAGYNAIGHDSFVDYQTKIQGQLARLADLEGWRSIALSSGASIEENVENVRTRVAELL